MNRNIFNKSLLKFIEKSTCSFLCVKEIKSKLDESGYVEILENEEFNKDINKFYITRNDSSIIAVSIPKNYKKYFKIVTTHCDTPSLILKPECSYIKNNYLKLNVMSYGGLLNFGWIDQPLSISGRVIINKKNRLISKIVDFKDPLIIIPSVAIHQKSNSNRNLKLEEQEDLQPIMGLSNSREDFKNKLESILKEKIYDYDLYIYNRSKPILAGNNNEFLFSPRIDNLTSVYSALTSFIENNSNNINVFCTFDNEEIGSLTEEGAESNFLINVLKRIATTYNFDLAAFLSKTIIINSDNTHGVHPNHPEYSDITGKSFLGKGLCIIREAGTSTNSVSSSLIKKICEDNKIEYQVSTARDNISGGSTLSGLNIRHVSSLSVDIGICELSMHSSIETCSINDVYELYKLFNVFYRKNIIKSNFEIKF